MLTKADLEREWNTKISADGKSLEARHCEECATLRDEIVALCESIEESLDDDNLGILEDVCESLRDAADRLGIPY